MSIVESIPAAAAGSAAAQASEIPSPRAAASLECGTEWRESVNHRLVTGLGLPESLQGGQRLDEAPAPSAAASTASSRSGQPGADGDQPGADECAGGAAGRILERNAAAPECLPRGPIEAFDGFDRSAQSAHHPRAVVAVPGGGIEPTQLALHLLDRRQCLPQRSTSALAERSPGDAVFTTSAAVSVQAVAVRVAGALRRRPCLGHVGTDARERGRGRRRIEQRFQIVIEPEERERHPGHVERGDELADQGVVRRETGLVE